MQTPGLAPSFVTHSLSAAHGLHVLLAVSQMGLLAVVQSVFDTHSTQAPPFAQAGVGALHAVAVPASPPVVAAQPTQILARQKALFAVLQSPSFTHSTQLPEMLSQVEIALGQPASTAAQETQLLAVEQNGTPASLLHWSAVLQATHCKFTQ